MSTLLQRLLMGAILLGFVTGWPLWHHAEARRADPGQKNVPAAVFKDSSFKLVGTAITRDPSMRVAVIEDLKHRRQRSYHEGDRAGGMLIKSIRRDHIVIDTGKGDETVKISAYLGQGRPTTASPHLPSKRHSPGLSPPSTNRVGSRQRFFVIDRSAAEAAFANPASVLDRVEIKPARLLNREVGFRIAAFESQSILSKMGLRSGDQLLTINDQEIAGPQEAMSFFEILRQGGDIDLTVRRRARTYHINLLIQ